MPQNGTTGAKAPEQQNAWIARVLGVILGGVAPAPAADPATWRVACAGFQDAIDTVSAQLEELRQQIAQYGDELEDEELTELARRADFGINGFTENTLVRLRTAMTVSSTNDLARLRAAVPKVVESAKIVRDALEKSEQVDVCDDNPFGVTVTIVGTLVPAVSNLITVGTRLLAA